MARSFWCEDIHKLIETITNGLKKGYGADYQLFSIFVELFDNETCDEQPRCAKRGLDDNMENEDNEPTSKKLAIMLDKVQKIEKQSSEKKEGSGK